MPEDLELAEASEDAEMMMDLEVPKILEEVHQMTTLHREVLKLDPRKILRDQ